MDIWKYFQICISLPLISFFIKMSSPYDTGGAEGAIAPHHFFAKQFLLHRILKAEK